MANFVITGGAGFIGSHIAEKLVALGHKAKIIDNFSTGKMENLQSFRDQVEVITGDIRDMEVLKRSFTGAEYVFHEASTASVQASIEDPIATEDNNVRGTIKVLTACRDAGVKRVVFASSAAIYGDSPILPKEESMKPEPLSPYAAHKVMGEYYLQIYSKIFGLETVALRYFNVFGPRQDPHSPYSGVISIFADRMLKGISPTVFGDGEQTRDFIYIDNVVNGNISAALSHKVGHGEVINIASGESASINELIRNINLVLQKDIAVDYRAAKAGDIRFSEASIDEARRLLDFKVQVGLSEGLGKLMDWVKKSKGQE